LSSFPKKKKFNVRRIAGRANQQIKHGFPISCAPSPWRGVLLTETTLSAALPTGQVLIFATACPPPAAPPPPLALHAVHRVTHPYSPARHLAPRAFCPFPPPPHVTSQHSKPHPCSPFALQTSNRQSSARSRSPELCKSEQFRCRPVRPQ